MRRQYIFDTIRGVFRTYGFAPLETPSMENLSTLLGKYGDEGDKLLFKILNSGDFLSGVSDEQLHGNPNALASKICEKGLRYDLTVPFARYVVQHQGELTFPFKRYQIQPVWRADRPQKGRYREFYQCDVDVIGTRSLLCEVELVEIVERVFRALGIRVALKMNNRKILFGIAEAIGHADMMMDITIAIDKLEKIGLDNVKAELLERGLSREAVDKLQPILELSGDNAQKLMKLREVLAVSETGLKGIEEMETVLGYVERLGIGLDVELDLSLARGLNYYTGAIFEVKALMTQMPQVLVLGVVRLAADLQRDVMSLGVVNLLIAALDVPLTPRGDDLQIGCKVHDGQLKAHLIVALAGAAMADGVGTLGAGNLHDTLCQNRAGKAGAQQIALVIGPGLHGGDDIILHELVGQVFNVQLRSAACLGALFQPFQFAFLAHIAADGDDLAVVVMLFQPRNDDGRIQTAGICQHDLFDFRHGNCLRSKPTLILSNSLLQFPIAVAIIRAEKECVKSILHIAAM